MTRESFGRSRLNAAERAALVAFADGANPGSASLSRLTSRGLLVCSHGPREIKPTSSGGFVVRYPRSYFVTAKGRAVVARWRAEHRHGL